MEAKNFTVLLWKIFVGSMEYLHATFLEMRKVHIAKNPDINPMTCISYAVISYNRTQNKTH